MRSVADTLPKLIHKTAALTGQKKSPNQHHPRSINSPVKTYKTIRQKPVKVLWRLL